MIIDVELYDVLKDVVAIIRLNYPAGDPTGVLVRVMALQDRLVPPSADTLGFRCRVCGEYWYYTTGPLHGTPLTICSTCEIASAMNSRLSSLRTKSNPSCHCGSLRRSGIDTANSN